MRLVSFHSTTGLIIDSWERVEEPEDRALIRRYATEIEETLSVCVFTTLLLLICIDSSPDGNFESLQQLQPKIEIRQWNTEQLQRWK